MTKLISEKYAAWKKETEAQFQKLKANEEELNRIFIEIYGLQNELSPEVAPEAITLTSNPAYRYKGNQNPEEREKRLLQDSIQELISYAVGCIFGRYSLDKDGLILANQGEGLAEYRQIISKEPSFMPSTSNVLPLIGGDWFEDDVNQRFREFLKVAYGEQSYSENLRFVESALGKELESYFQKDFYKNHLKTYKKRPIYWLFSSPKGYFKALIYLHRYQPETVSVLLNQYLREYIAKLENRRSFTETQSNNPSLSQKEQTAATRELNDLEKILLDLREYETKIIFPLAGEKIPLDLDDGVKENYAKFGKALEKI